jgi:hypothetical protein
MQTDNGATDDQLWRALNALCATVVDGDQDQWRVVETAFGNAGAQHFANPCLENAARALLARALTWHEAYPDGRPQVHFPVAAAETDCGKAAKQNDGQDSGQDRGQDGEQPSEPSGSSPPSEPSGTTPSN